MKKLTLIFIFALAVTAFADVFNNHTGATLGGAFQSHGKLSDLYFGIDLGTEVELSRLSIGSFLEVTAGSEIAETRSATRSQCFGDLRGDTLECFSVLDSGEDVQVLRLNATIGLSLKLDLGNEAIALEPYITFPILYDDLEAKISDWRFETDGTIGRGARLAFFMNESVKVSVGYEFGALKFYSHKKKRVTLSFSYLWNSDSERKLEYAE